MLLKDILLQLVKPFDALDANYYFILGSCMPKDSLLLKSSNVRLPEKLRSIVDGKLQLKYLLKEHDIKLDIVLFNQVFIDIFNQLFESKDAICRLLGSNFKNVIFAMNKKLDCYALFKTVKFLYGRSNCINLHKKLECMPSPIIAVNDLICKHIHSKSALNKSKEFKIAVTEVKQFLDEKMKEVSGI